MTTNSVSVPFPIFTDIDGNPLELGNIYIGQPNLDPQTSPKNAYWDAAMTLQASQPIQTRGGYPVRSGTPARIYVDGDYSIKVNNRNGTLIYSAPTRTEQLDSAVVNYTPSGTGAVATTVQSKLRGTAISVFDFMSDAQRTDAMSATPTVDCTNAVQAAVNHATSLQGRVTIEGYGLCVIAGTVNFSHGETRKPIYFTGGGYKKTNAGTMFSASVDNSGDVYFDNVYFESASGAGTKIFSTDYIIRLHTTNCVFRNCDYVWYSGDDVSAGFAYSQSCRSIGDTVTGGVGYAFDLASAFDCVWDNLTLEARESGIRVRSTGQGVHGGRIVNSALEGLTGTAIRIDGATLALAIENNYFELNKTNHIVFTNTIANLVVKNNFFSGPDNPATNGTAAIVWPSTVQNPTSINNHSINLQLHDVAALTVGYIWSHQDKNGTGKTWDNSKILRLNPEAWEQTTVDINTVTKSYLGTFQRLTIQRTVSVPNAATTDYTVDFGVAIRTDDFVSIQCNTTADVRLLKYRKSGNTIIYTVRNDTGSAQSTTFTICVLKPYFSVIG